MHLALFVNCCTFFFLLLDAQEKNTAFFYMYSEFASEHGMQAKCIKATVVHPLSKVILIFML